MKEGHHTPPGTPPASYAIPKSILKRLTPVSPEKKQPPTRRDNLLLQERRAKLKEYSLKVENINKRHKQTAERRRRYSNESLQTKLDNARMRRTQSNMAKSQRAHESLKMITSDNSLSNALAATKAALRTCKEASRLEQVHRARRDAVSGAVLRYLARDRLKYLSAAMVSANYGDLVKDRQVIDAVTLVFRALQIPSYTGNDELDARTFLQSFHYVEESKDMSLMNGMVTTVPTVKEKEPLNSVFNNDFNNKIISLLLKVSSKLIVAFKLFTISNLNKLNVQFLSFIKLWKLFYRINSIFLKFHSIRSILNLHHSIEILQRSQRMTRLKLSDFAYAPIRDELQADISKYDTDIMKIRHQLKVFQKSASRPSIADIYYITGELKRHKTVYNTKDLFPTFLKKMENWRMVLIYEEFFSLLQTSKDNCTITDFSRLEEDVYSSKYALFCSLLNLENYIQTLSADQELTEFGIRLYDFLNNSFYGETKLFPMLQITDANFPKFFESAIKDGFEDLLDESSHQRFEKLLSNSDHEEGILQAKEFLIQMTVRAISFILKSNLPNDRKAFERYQFNRKFEILTCPILVERYIDVIRDNKSVKELITVEVLNFINDDNYKLIETLQMFKLVILKLKEQYPVQSFLAGDTALNLEVRQNLNKLVALNINCYRNVYEEVANYIKGNFSSWRV